MEEMIDRVAMALGKACPFVLQERSAEIMARAAIEAMKEPRPRMLRAAIDAIPMDKYINIGARLSNVTLSTDECTAIWCTMIDAALSPSTRGE